MAKTDTPIDEILFRALKLENDADRADYLNEVCGTDADFRTRVEKLLGAYPEAGSFLDSPAVPAGPTVDLPKTEKPGTWLGPYKLQQQIGKGGMGVVYMAEQTEPVERRVALKIIKPGMDTQQVIARFEAERQALAMMDHPNIAKVLDAGTTDSGRPYFVMELVKGVPVTEYCDEQHLTPRERLELLVPICQAVQHAHQKGVIHRDLKPTNILIAQYDNKPVPKVIDFGVAKAISHKLTEKTMFTQFGQIVGTIDYMSPEQARFNQLDVDTRSDVYSLGVLLYELLTGETPFDRKRLHNAAFDEMLRILREEEPPKPSLKLSSSQSLPSIAANRQTNPQKLSTLVRGELDWIVMKALEKDRGRRYETPNAFAEDVRHYLNNEAVLACPPSAAYRFRKFARRNKAPLAITSAALVGLVVVAIGATIAAGNFRNLAQQKAELVVELDSALETAVEAEENARASQQQAEDARDKEQELRLKSQQQTAIAQQQSERAEANFALARSAVDEFLNQVTENELLTVPGMQPLRQTLLSSAMEFYEDFTQDAANAAELQSELARAHYRIGVIRSELDQDDEARVANTRAVEAFEELFASGRDTLEVRLGLARSYFKAGRPENTVRLCREILETHPQHAETRSLLANTFNTLAIADKNDKDIAAALGYHQQALELREGLARDFPGNPTYLGELGGTVNNLGVIHAQQGNHRLALEMYARAIEYDEEAYRKEPHTIRWGRWLSIGLRNVAIQRTKFGEQAEALKAYERVVDVRRKLAFQNPAVPSLRGELFRAWYDLGNYQETLGLSFEAAHSFRAAEGILKNINTNIPSDLFNLAIVYGALATPPEGTNDEPDATAEAERQRYADLAIRTLEQAIEKGYRDLRTLKNHEYLAIVRERDAFQELILGLEAEMPAFNDSGSDEEKLARLDDAAAILRKQIDNQQPDHRHRETLAATLHSIGVIQTALKQFDAAKQSLNESLQLRDELIAHSDDPSLTLDVIETHVALGELHWKQGDYPQAHQYWSNCMERTLALAQSNRTNQDVQRQLSVLERQIIEYYGRLGIYSLIQPYFHRALEFQRVSLVDTPGLEVDSAISAAALLGDDLSVARRYIEQLHDAIVRTESKAEFHLHYLVRNVVLLGESELRSEAFLQEAVNDREKHLGDSRKAIGVAAAHLARNEIDLMHDAMESEGDSSLQVNYLKMISWAKAGENHKAHAHVDHSESIYQSRSREVLLSPITNLDSGIHGAGWSQFFYAQALRREALRRIGTSQSIDDPWKHLIQSRGYHLIGETEKARAELAAAEKAAPQSRDAWMAQAQLVSNWEDGKDLTEAAWQRAAELAGDDPMLWIRRGRWYAGRGEHQKADADLARAAALTPDELNRFLEDGWWVVGPYPDDLDEICPPEINPNPSQLVHLIDPQNGLSDVRVAWRNAQNGHKGMLSMNSVLGSNQGSGYALAYIYSLEECTRLLRINGAKGIRVWCNGKPVCEAPADRALSDTDLLARRVPVTLRSGRNVILLRARLDAPITIRVADTPADQVMAYAEQRLWKEAVDAAVAAEPSAIRNGALYAACIKMAVLCNNQKLIDREVEWLLRMATSHSNRWDQVRAAEALSHIESPLVRNRAPHLIASLTDLRPATSDNRNMHKYCLGSLVNFAVLLGDNKTAREFLIELQGLNGNWTAAVAPQRAIVESMSGDREKALAAFESGINVAMKPHYWPWRVGILAQLRTAELTLTGNTDRIDEILKNERQEALAGWENRDHLTAAYDHVIAAPIYESAQFSEKLSAYIGRGRRLVELGRFDEAKSDFDKARELAPNDAEVLIARAEFLLDRGQTEEATDDFVDASSMLTGLPSRRLRARLIRLRHNADTKTAIGQLDRLIATFHPRLDSDRQDAIKLLQIFDIEANRAASSETLEKLSSEVEAISDGAGVLSQAAWQLLHNRRSEYELTCRTAVERLEESTTHTTLHRIARASAFSKTPPLATDQLVEIARRSVALRPDATGHFTLGLCLFRDGQVDEAIQTMRQSLDQDWEGEPLSWLGLALAHSVHGEPKEAQQWLAKAREWFEQHPLDLTSDMHPHGRLGCQLLLREAEQRIEGDLSSEKDTD